jgi:uncharacterized cofD-like protein
LYTSILANCVIGGVREVIAGRTEVPLVYVCNLMSRSGQTIGMQASDYVQEISRYVGRVPSHVLINTTLLPEDLLAHYKAEGNHPVAHDCAAGVCSIHAGDLVAMQPIQTVAGDVLKRSLIRHDGDKLASVLLGIALK